MAQNVARYEQAHPAQGNDPDDKQRVLEVERLAEQAIEKANQGIPVSLAERESFSRVTRGKKLEDEYQKATGVPFYQDFNAPATEMEGSIEFNLQRQRQLSEQKAQEVAEKASMETTGGGILRGFRQLPPEYQTPENLNIIARTSQARQYSPIAGFTSGKSVLTVEDVERERKRIESQQGPSQITFGYLEDEIINKESVVDYFNYSATNPFDGGISNDKRRISSQADSGSDIIIPDSFDDLSQTPQRKGFEERIEGIKKREEAFFNFEGFKRTQQLASLVTLGGGKPVESRGKIGRLAEKTLGGIFASGPSLGGSLANTEEKIFAFGEGWIYSETRKRILPELGRAGIETIKGPLNPATDEGQINYIFAATGAVVPALKNSNQPSPFKPTGAPSGEPFITGEFKFTQQIPSKVGIFDDSVFFGRIANDPLLKEPTRLYQGQPIKGQISITDFETGAGFSALEVGTGKQQFQIYQKRTSTETINVVKQQGRTLLKETKPRPPVQTSFEEAGVELARSSELQASREGQFLSVARAEENIVTRNVGKASRVEEGLFTRTKTKEVFETTIDTQAMQDFIATNKVVVEYDIGKAEGVELYKNQFGEVNQRPFFKMENKDISALKTIPPEFQFGEVEISADQYFLTKSNLGEFSIGAVGESKPLARSSATKTTGSLKYYLEQQKSRKTLPEVFQTFGEINAKSASSGPFFSSTIPFPLGELTKPTKIAIPSTKSPKINPFKNFDVQSLELPDLSRVPTSRTPTLRVVSSRVKSREDTKNYLDKSEQNFKKQFERQFQNNNQFQNVNFDVKLASRINLRRSQYPSQGRQGRISRSLSDLDIKPRQRITNIQSQKVTPELALTNIQLPKQDVAFDFKTDLSTDLDLRFDFKNDIKIPPIKPTKIDFSFDLPNIPMPPPFIPPDFKFGSNSEFGVSRKSKQRKLYSPSIYSQEFGVRSSKKFDFLNSLKNLSGVEIRPIPSDFPNGRRRRKVKLKRRK